MQQQRDGLSFAEGRVYCICYLYRYITRTSHPNQPAYTVTLFGKNLGKAVRPEHWRYAEWPNSEAGGAMLFDRQKDPNELKNLAGDAAHAKVVKEMKALLERLPK
jgi:hypothetical protein